MESKKLQQFQQANSHLAPKPMPPPKGFSGNEYHPRSPLFGPVPVHSQYQNMALNFGHDTQIYDRGLNDNENLQMDHQIYQNQRFYQPRTHMHPNYQTHMHPNQVMNQPNPSQMHQHPRQLQEQYRQIQQAKLQQQMQFQNQAMLNQQQTFATRQTQHFHQNPKVDEMPVTPHRQNMINPVNEHRNVPTTLNVHPQQMGYYDEYNIQNMNMNNQIDKMSNQLAHQNMNKNHPYSNQYPMKQLNSTPIQSDLIQSTNYQSNQHSLPDSAYTNPTTKPVHYVGPTPLQTSPNQNTLHSPQSPQSSSVMLSPDKRRGSGGNQALRAPIARRPVSAPVTISGWLHKQGSDGLKVWRKRWFVLTEYCLFYYKGPEEEKLLGSVLLPSYHISACSPEEKNFRRYSFRCEHANMRTYLLAADTQSSMAAWLRAFKLASLMQCSSESDQASQSQSQPSLTSLNQSGDNSDSGIHTLPSQGKIAGTQTSPINSPQSGALDNIPLPGQPLYANAPPKPRRSNDGGYSSPSPECSLERYDEPSYDIRREAQNRLHQSRLNAKSPIPSDAIYESHSHQYHPSHPYHPGHPNRPPPPRTNAKSPEPLYNAQNLSLPLQNTAQMRLDHNKSPVMRLPKNKSPYYPDYQYNNPETVSPRRPHNNEVENSENIIRAPQRFLDKTDEYDIYGQNYKQHMNELRQNELYIQSKQNQKYPPMSPSERRTPDTYGRSRSTQVVRNNDVKNATRNVADYEDIYNGPPNEELIRYQRPMSPVVVDTEKRVIPMPQRYTPTNLDLRYSQIPVKMRIKQSPQQKNNRPHSADFLEYEAKQQSSQHIYQPQRQAPRPKSSLDINRSPLDAHGDNLYYSEAGYAEKMRQSAQYLQKTPKTVIASQAARKRYEDRFDLVQKRINKEGDIIYSNSPSNMEISGFNSKMTEVQPYSQDTIMSDGLLSQSRDSEEISRVSDYQRQGSSSVPRSYKEHDNGLHFIRSASARLARPNRDDESGASKDGARKVQQREESMKRLLEWKQRMLQSPLTRKVPPSLQTVSRLSRMGSPLGTLVQGGSITRSVGAHIRKPLPNNYNSYSSDDEASGSVSFAGLAPPLPKQQSHQQQGSRENIPVAGGIPIRAVSPRVRLSQENLMLSSGQIKDPAPYHLRDHTNPHPSASENIMPDEIYARNKYQPAHYHEEQYSRRDMELKHNKYNDQLYDTRNNKYGDYHIYGTADILNKVHQNHNELNSQHYRTSDDNCGDVGSNGDKLKGDWTIKRGNNQVDDQHFMDREATGIRHLDMSAGDLLGRTHEELVLLLIQLRRQNTSTARAIEQCCTQVHQCQSRLSTTDSAQRLENLQRLDQLKQHLLDLEKQYEKSKPLVNLVDNMVKLGALYRGSPHPQVSSVPTETATLDRLEFNQRIQERRLLQEERKHWDRLSPNQMQLQSKVKQLYQLDQLLQEESGTLQGLQRDKEALERALGGLRTRLQGPPRDPVLLEQARRQQQTLENELSRVHLLLAHNSKKLEQTVAGNARLEQELLVLRQKLQESRGARGSQQISNQGAPDSVTYAGGATALLESELRRVQLVVGDLQRQRQELSSAVKQLTDKSQCLVQQIQPRSTSSSNLKKRSDLSWLETDLDSLETCEHGAGEWTESVNSSSTTPLYIDTTPPEQQMHGSEDDTTLEATESDLEQSGFPNLATQEKQEIKTVRIVKRESERRQRDRERSTGPSWGNHSSQNLDQVIEEETRVQNEEYQRSLSLPRSFHHMPLSQSSPVLSPTDNTYQHIKYTSVPQNHNVYNTDFYTRNNNDHLYESETNVPASTNNPFAYDNRISVKLDTSHPFIATACSKEDHSRPLKLTQKSESIASLNRSIELSPVFKSEAAKQIVNEMLVTIDVPGTSSEGTNEQAAQISAHNQRRTVPKEKRRHYTAPHHLSSKSLLTMQAENDFKTTSWRARDDLDMERALRPRSNAPDVVRSTMVANHESNTGHDGDLSELVLMRDARSTVYARDPKFTETTIDKLLAAPSKILIPERYIPEQVPEPTPEELERRQQKAESIRKMLSTTPMGPTNKTSPEGPMKEEKRQREHLLQLNQILAKQVMEMSKIVAGSNSAPGGPP